jgi:hypothetical protein
LYAEITNDQTTIINNIITSSTTPTVVHCASRYADQVLTFRSNNVHSSQGQPFGGVCQDQAGVSGNISADPLFVNPSGGNYHLQLGSPSIDAGENSVPELPAKDIDGDPRIWDGNGDGVATIDQGIYEVIPPVQSFDLCIQDDSSVTILRVNSNTGAYELRNCHSLLLSGVATLTRKGGLITVQDFGSDRRVLAKVDSGINKATATAQLFSPAVTYTISDRNTSDNTCTCR